MKTLIIVIIVGVVLYYIFVPANKKDLDELRESGGLSVKYGTLLNWLFNAGFTIVSKSSRSIILEQAWSEYDSDIGANISGKQQHMLFYAFGGIDIHYKAYVNGTQLTNKKWNFRDRDWTQHDMIMKILSDINTSLK